MKLPQPFYRLPLRFDAQRLASEVQALPEDAWVHHPTGYAGNSSVRLVSVAGGENDLVTGGAMAPTPWLQRSPYLQQVLASFHTVWSRSRLMRLEPGACVPEHVDLSYHWFSRVRVHVPILTEPRVLFTCGDEQVHMAAGEAWIFDNWRQHRVDNPSENARIHLVADTTGSAHFWELVAAADSRGPLAFPFRENALARLALENGTLPAVVPPAELEQLLADFVVEVVPREDSGSAQDAVRFIALLKAFEREWRQLWMLNGDASGGLASFRNILGSLRVQAQGIGESLIMRTNRMPAMQVLNARLQFSVEQQAFAASGAVAGTPNRSQRIERPVFIIAAPRSGSTLLYETLACSPQLHTLGGEAHWLVEGIAGLTPGTPTVSSNRVVASHLTPAMAARLREAILERAHLPDGRCGESSVMRLLEKTPKNALRIPFLDALFPDALFIHLWREPRPNIASIIEAWRDGRWITYERLPGRRRPWSMLLPPGWPAMEDRSVEEIAAFQWESANRIVLDDLESLPPERHMRISYEALLGNPELAIRELCDFAAIEFDETLARRVRAPLPASRYTLTAPDAEKWRRHANAVEALASSWTTTLTRLAAPSQS